jgi:carbamoyl-phosphate synthase / aspartate carbamoyltransferase / dihydroorotase
LSGSGERIMKLPGLIDIHVHMREPGAEHKEDWASGTAAALAGGFTVVLAMPNTQPPITNELSLSLASEAARQKARCDFAQFLGAGPDNAASLPALSQRAAGLKMYLDQTYGPLQLDDMSLWREHLRRWPDNAPVAAHAEGRSMAAIILAATFYDRSIHMCHVSTREEILLIKAAKEKGLKVTCEVTPHHLYLNNENTSHLGDGRSEVRTRLASQADCESLWENLKVIDCFATDHAPHTLAEKDGGHPPPGFPGLETAFPLLYTAVSQGRLSLDDLVARLYTNPRRIFAIPEQPQTWIEFDPKVKGEIASGGFYTRCDWSPFTGWKTVGQVTRVVLRGNEAFRDGRVLAPPGYGINVKRL